MDLNHIHLGSKNLGKSVEFYQSFFGFKKTMDHGDGVFLKNDENFLIAIDPVEELPNLPTWFHLGFCLDKFEDVKPLFEKMKLAEVEFPKEYQEWGKDAAAFYCLDPDGYRIEVSWHSEDGE